MTQITYSYGPSTYPSLPCPGPARSLSVQRLLPGNRRLWCTAILPGDRRLWCTTILPWNRRLWCTTIRNYCGAITMCDDHRLQTHCPDQHEHGEENNREFT